MPVADLELATGLPGLYAVIPAGGSGTRLWPLSRTDSPKFLHDLTGSGASLLQDTVARLQPLCGERVVVVTGARHAQAVTASLPTLSGENLIVEPSPKDSLPAIGLAAAVLQLRDPDAIIGSFAADHVITDQAAFSQCVAEAVDVARTGVLVTVGITPTYPATGFGYVQPGSPYQASTEEPNASAEHQARWVPAFVEKPPLHVAKGYIESGYLWNAGMFIVRASVLMAMIERWEPRLATGLRDIAAARDTIDDVWPTLPACSIDRTIAEPAAAAGAVVVVRARFGWDDIGDFASLANQLPPSIRHAGLRVLGAEDTVLSVDSSGIVAARGGRTVVLLGVPDAVVIDTPDAVLVTTRERAQDVKGIVDALVNNGRQDLT